MQLCVDIGNTRVKSGVFENSELLLLERKQEFELAFHQNLLDKFAIDNIIISSTRAEDPELVALLKTRPGSILLDHATPLPITLQYKTPHTLGKDRLAAAVACFALFPGEDCIFIDAGTCITTNVISGQGVFLGGNISPGVQMRLKAMHMLTGKLPLSEIQYNDEVLGQDTMMALQNGAVRGAIYEVSSFLNKCGEMFPSARIVLTGGDAILFAKHLKIKIFANPNLVLLGLNEILRFNAGPKH
ncbi:MAG: type III pantothenate kinase [Saprospiraceae bacterium]|nr:type III pantothenate kinase [Saprospiraceae bacterium]